MPSKNTKDRKYRLVMNVWKTEKIFLNLNAIQHFQQISATNFLVLKNKKTQFYY